ALPAPARPRPRSRRQRQRHRHPRAAEGALPRDADDRVAESRGDLRRDASARGSGGMTNFRLVEKEIRALPLPWLGSAGAMAGSATFRSGQGLGVGVYFLGAAGLGALALGHEYSHRTLGTMLAQPIGRRRVLTVKLAVLAVALLALAAVAARFVFGGD